MPHVLEHHGERFSVSAHSVEADDVLMLEHGQELGLALEVLPSRLVSVLQRLHEKNSQEPALPIWSRISDQLFLDYRLRAKVCTPFLNERMNDKTLK